MVDKIEAAQERVEECARFIRELLDDYNCQLTSDPVSGSIFITGYEEDSPYFHEVEI